jgi:beta-glucosidase/6-phospho-beta-glucosidase/beta-galactosidase
VFDSFFLAGFECATGYNNKGEWIDQVEATQHDLFINEDYKMLSDVGIMAVRDAVRWPLVDCNGHYDFSTVKPICDASRRFGVSVIYDLFHYGYPMELDLLSDEFPERFAAYCYAVARYIRGSVPGPYYFTPINEPSYYSWAAGEVGQFAPHLVGRGWDLKVALIRAALSGIDAIRSVIPDARIVNVDPICHVVAPEESSELESEAHYFNNSVVFQSWDMLSGKLLPELGGSPDKLDIVGMNYYWTNQWVLGQAGTPLDESDERCQPLSNLIRNVWERYQREIIVTETSHIDDCRPGWVRQLAHEAETVLEEGIPLRGICLYPILNMPEWHDRDTWTRMGLWDLKKHKESLKRVLCQEVHEALMEAQRRVEYSYISL